MNSHPTAAEYAAFSADQKVEYFDFLVRSNSRPIGAARAEFQAYQNQLAAALDADRAAAADSDANNLSNTGQHSSQNPPPVSVPVSNKEIWQQIVEKCGADWTRMLTRDEFSELMFKGYDKGAVLKKIVPRLSWLGLSSLACFASAHGHANTPEIMSKTFDGYATPLTEDMLKRKTFPASQPVSIMDLGILKELPAKDRSALTLPRVAAALGDVALANRLLCCREEVDILSKCPKALCYSHCLAVPTPPELLPFQIKYLIQFSRMINVGKPKRAQTMGIWQTQYSNRCFLLLEKGVLTKCVERLLNLVDVVLKRPIADNSAAANNLTAGYVQGEPFNIWESDDAVNQMEAALDDACRRGLMKE